MSFCYEEWQPYAYTNEQGESVGLSIEDISKKLQHAKITYSFKELPFPLCKQAVLSGKIDFILHVDDTDSFALLEPPINNWQLTFAVKETNTITFEQIMHSQGLNVLTARSYSYPEKVEQDLVDMSANRLKVSYYTGEVDALKRLFHRLTSEQADVMVVDKIWAKGVVKKYQLPIKVLEPLIVSVPQFIGFNANNSVRADQLKQALFYTNGNK